MPAASEIGTWILVAIALLPAVRAVMEWTRGSARRIEPQPLVVKSADEYALRDHVHPGLVSTSDCEAEHSEAGEKLDSALHDIRAMLDAHSTSAEVRARKLHERLDPIAQNVAAVTARVNDHLEDHRKGRT